VQIDKEDQGLKWVRSQVGESQIEFLRISAWPHAEVLEFSDIASTSESRKKYLLKQLSSPGVSEELLRVVKHLSVHWFIMFLSKEVLRVSIEFI
jgi:hypothetical protein